MPTPGNHGVGSVTPGDSTGAQNGIIFLPASFSPPCSRTVTWSRHLFSLTNIPQLDRAGSFISEKGLDIRALAPTVAPLMCQCSPSTSLLFPTHTPDPYTTCESQTCSLLTPLSYIFQTDPTNPDPGPTATCCLTNPP